MKSLRRSLMILLAGVAVSGAWYGLGLTSWAESQRAPRGGLRQVATEVNGAGPVERQVAEGGGGGRGSRGGQVTGRAGGRGRGGRGSSGLFTHYRGSYPLSGDLYRLAQILGLQIGVPAAVTLGLLGIVRFLRGRKRREATGR